MSTGTKSSSEAVPRICVIVPAYNEIACIRDVLTSLCVVYPSVVVVDDGSTDGTFNAAKELAPYVLRHAANRGQGAALQTGIEFALRRGAEYIVTFDADGQHRVEDIDALLEPLVLHECEVTLGSRFLGQASQMPISRRLLLRIAILFTHLASRMPVTDVHNGLRAFTRRAAQCVNMSMDRMAHASEILDIIRRSQLPFREVPVQIRNTPYSLAKGQSTRGALRVLFHYLIGRAVR